ncbi:hypothetical protein GEV33_004500 [Tenebrio molitor]|uniref:Lipase n=1 Tax=Tenebrio molitor TaxID=7067 RepID=A0A8J6HQP5_TENMO|nr:hypothetical protein GEV33_004500 [Tenebrio molitor]
MLPVLMLLICLAQTSTSSPVNLENNACSHLLDYRVKSISRNCYHNPDVGATTPEMIKRNGYGVESHDVTTDDGYILQIYRVISKQAGSNEKKQPVYLEHGILLDSDAWTFVGERSLAYSLVDDGYDVWLGNQRGTPYSRRHETLKTTDLEYWDYNLDTVAVYDISASLNKVANETGMEGSIIYIGHSRGTTLIFMYAAEYPEETERLLKGIIALSPIAFFNPKPYIEFLLTIGPSLGKSLKALGIRVFFQYPTILKQFLEFICPSFPYFCEFIVFLVSGKLPQFMPEDLLNFFSHFPTSWAVNQAIQYSQMNNADKFQKFDYGKTKNLEEYGQDTPPEYDLGKIKLPVYLLYGVNDIFITGKSVKRVYDQLGSEKKQILKIPVDNDKKEDQFNHNDFFYAKNITTFLYEEMSKIMKDNLQPNGQ